MKHRSFLSFLTGSALVLALAVPAFAQAPKQPLSGGDDNSRLVAAGLTFLDAGTTGIGIAANVLFNTLKTTSNGRIGIVGDVGFNHFDGGTVLSVMGAARYTFVTSGRVLPYGQFGLNLAHCCGSTNFDPALGFGADISATPTMNFRGEVTFIMGDGNSTRWFFGVSFPMKKK